MLNLKQHCAGRCPHAGQRTMAIDLMQSRHFDATCDGTISIPDRHKGSGNQCEQKDASIHATNFPESADLRVLESLIVVAQNPGPEYFFNGATCVAVEAE